MTLAFLKEITRGPSVETLREETGHECTCSKFSLFAVLIMLLQKKNVEWWKKWNHLKCTFPVKVEPHGVLASCCSSPTIKRCPSQ